MERVAEGQKMTSVAMVVTKRLKIGREIRIVLLAASNNSYCIYRFKTFKINVKKKKEELF